MLNIMKRLTGLLVITMLTCALMSMPQTSRADARLKGKRVVFIPIAMGITLTEAWAKGMALQANTHGFKFEIKDANWKFPAMAEIFASTINSKPDVIVAHNLTLQFLSRHIRKAESKGIPVLQINLQSNQKSTAFIGADWARIGREVAKDIVSVCGKGSGKSGKVAIVPGQLTAADSVIINKSTFAVFEKHPEIKVVSNQASDWEPEKARKITATVLQQHPDLCAVFGHWGVHTVGAGNAVKNAGKADSVTVYATGGGNRMICDKIKEGVIDRYWSYNAEGQGRDAGVALRMILQGARPEKGEMLVVASPLIVIKKESLSPSQCWDL